MKIVKLTRDGFAAFGEVIETADAQQFLINNGYATRFDRLALPKFDKGAGKISIFEVRPRPAPIKIDMMERHPLGSQAFYPLQNEDWLVVVCADPLDVTSFRCFLASGLQGVNYARGTWHFPLLVFGPSRFIIVDREWTEMNLEEVALSAPLHIVI